jgi:hypothetical protein
MRGAVLIIGSLKWDASERRAIWRSKRLSMNCEIPVRVALRYGRTSVSRDKTFTMVIGGVRGTGLLVPFKSEISNVDDLMAEAEALWEAEAESSNGRISAMWGSVGAAFQATDTSTALANDWTTGFKKKKSNSVEPVNAAGILKIDWPTDLTGKPAAFDVIIATATKPGDTTPNPSTVASAWANQDKGREDYFLQNVLHGIRTADDLEIWRHLRKASPKWLKSPHHAAAMSILDAEIAKSKF